MKKALLALVLVIAVVASVFATQSVSLYGSPYSLLYIDSSTKGSIHSSFGFGGMLEYRANPIFDNNFVAGASAGVQGFKISDFDVPEDYSVFFLKANAGCEFPVTDEFTVTPYFSAGFDVAHQNSTSIYFDFGPALNLAYHLQGSVDVSADISGTFAFPKTTENQFEVSRLNIFVGATYKF